MAPPIWNQLSQTSKQDILQAGTCEQRFIVRRTDLKESIMNAIQQSQPPTEEMINKLPVLVPQRHQDVWVWRMPFKSLAVDDELA
jgi:hypothetical protein